jgi:hypothetical protein
MGTDKLFQINMCSGPVYLHPRKMIILVSLRPYVWTLKTSFSGAFAEGRHKVSNRGIWLETVGPITQRKKYR